MTEEVEKTICEYCGKSFKNISRHQCKVKALEEESQERKGKEIEVKASSTASIIPDRFWAWTEGFGLQIGTIIGFLEDFKNNMGNTYSIIRSMNVTAQHIRDSVKIMRENMDVFKDIKTSLMAINTSIADVLETKKYGKIIDEDRIEELKENKKIKKVSPGFESKPKPKTQEEADIETLEELEEEGLVEVKSVPNSDVVSYKDDETLPEHTRKLEGKIDIATPKALMILFANGKEAWIPKSTLKGDYEEEKGLAQDFIIDSWVLIKNGVIEKEE